MLATRTWDLPFYTALFEPKLPELRPPVMIRETSAAFVLSADLPGVSKDAVTVKHDTGILIIDGARASPENPQQLVRQDQRFGRFQLKFSLPDDCDANQIEATMNDGVLCVTIPKRSTAEAKLIPVKVN